MFLADIRVTRGGSTKMSNGELFVIKVGIITTKP